MDGPTHNLRATVISDLAGTRGPSFAARDEDAEDSLVVVLTNLEIALAYDRQQSRLVGASELSEEDGWDLLAAVEAWAGVASAAVAQVYAPASPWPRSVGGWGTKATNALQRITKLLLSPLQAAGKAVGASSWSVGVSFPWGLSVSLSWP